jgi:hypothetical protein
MRTRRAGLSEHYGIYNFRMIRCSEANILHFALPRLKTNQ